jgi:hypothetical protein
MEDTVTIKELIERIKQGLAPKLAERETLRKTVDDIRAACATDNDRHPTDVEAEQVRAAQARISEIDAEFAAQQARITELETEQARDEVAARISAEVHPTGAGAPAYDRVARVGQEARTYRRDSDPRGVQFLRDVATRFLFSDGEAADRLSQHMREERVERGGQMIDRAVGTAAFTGLVVPQYLTDLMAPIARAGRPFADACRHHDLPEQGMVVNIGKITTGTSAAVQASENASVSETDIDDTLLSVNVQTNAGSQTISRQGLERGTGVESTTLEDLFRAYGTGIDNTLLNQATNGLTNVASAVAYTDASPTAAELYPKLLAAPAAVEAALLDMDPGDLIAVMHSRRWYWIQSQLSSTWPLFGQPSVPAQLSGVNYGERYGSGFRGILPSGVPVIVDNNIATNLGAGTNEDEIYFASQSEAHLWENPNAPMLIRAEQPKAKNLGVDLVVYGYFAYTFARRAHAQKIGGTGLVTPVFA